VDGIFWGIDPLGMQLTSLERRTARGGGRRVLCSFMQGDYTKEICVQAASPIPAPYLMELPLQGCIMARFLCPELALRVVRGKEARLVCFAPR
jgi:hypothetical protein